MKKTKRILSLVLALVLVLSCFSGITVSAAGGRKWFVLDGGSSCSGGHSYSGSQGPMFYKNDDHNMVSGGTISLAVKPNNNCIRAQAVTFLFRALNK